MGERGWTYDDNTRKGSKVWTRKRMPTTLRGGGDINYLIWKKNPRFDLVSLVIEFVISGKRFSNHWLD